MGYQQGQPSGFSHGFRTILTPGESGSDRPQQLGSTGLRNLARTAGGSFSAWSVQPYVCPECTMPLLCPRNHICLSSFIEDTDVYHFNRIQEKTAVHLAERLPTTGFQYLKNKNKN